MPLRLPPSAFRLLLCAFVPLCLCAFAPSAQAVTKPAVAVWQSAHPLAGSCVGFWWLGEGTGSTAYDVCANAGHTARNGTITGASWVSDDYGTCLDFNGSSHKVLIGDFAEHQFTASSFTLQVVFKPDGVSGTHTIFGKGNPVGEGCPYCVVTNGAGARLYIGDGTNLKSRDSTTIAAGTWYQVLAVWTYTGAASQYGIEVDGVNYGPAADGFTTLGNKATLKIGVGSLGDGSDYNWFDGRVAMAAIYNAALTGKQRAMLTADPWCLVRPAIHPKSNFDAGFQR